MPFSFRFSPRLVRAVQILVFIGMAWLLWQATDGREALALLGSADPYWLAAAALMLTLQTLLSAQRWRITAAQLGIRISPGLAVREYYLAQIVNQSLPGGMIGDAGRVVRFRRDAGLFISGQAVLFERLSGQIGMLAVLLVGLTLTAFIPTGFAWPSWLTTPLTVSFVLLAGFILAMALVFYRSGSSDNAVRRFVNACRHAILARNVRVQQVGLSLGTALCNVVAFALCADALGISLPALVVVTLVPIILFAMLVPLSIGGWGFREGAAVMLFPLIGETPSEGLATSVAFGLIFLLAVLPGLFLSWWPTNPPAGEPH